MNYPNVKLVMKSSDTNGNSISTTIGYVNPNADDGVLKAFAEKLNAFTTNNFVGITKVTTDDIFNAEYFPYRMDVDPTEITFSDTTTTVTVTVTLPDSIPDDVVESAGISIGQTGGYTRGGTQGTGTRTITFTLKATSSSVEKSATVRLTTEESGESVQLTPTYSIKLIPNIG